MHLDVCQRHTICEIAITRAQIHHVRNLCTMPLRGTDKLLVLIKLIRHTNSTVNILGSGICALNKLFSRQTCSM